MAIAGSQSKIWWLEACHRAFKHARMPKDRLAFLLNRHYDLDTSLGRFSCADAASALQFAPGWEREVTLALRSRAPGLFLDVGANIGVHSVAMAKRGWRVISVEPSPKAFRCLEMNAKVNCGDTIELWNCAAWKSTSRLRLSNANETDVSRIGALGDDVIGLPLDEVLAGRTPDLVKIDVEGAEIEVLTGLRETLSRRVKPDVIFEALDPERLAECSLFLEGHGYEVCRLDDTNYAACADGARRVDPGPRVEAPRVSRT